MLLFFCDFVVTDIIFKESIIILISNCHFVMKITIDYNGQVRCSKTTLSEKSQASDRCLFISIHIIYITFGIIDILNVFVRRDVIFYDFVNIFSRVSTTWCQHLNNRTKRPQQTDFLNNNVYIICNSITVIICLLYD